MPEKHNERRPRVEQTRPKFTPPKMDRGVWDILYPFLKKQENQETEVEELFNYPFRSERERIRHNSVLYKDLSITEMFSEAYKVQLNPDLGNELPAEVSIGTILPLRILSISKENGVVFDSGVHKECFLTRNNLAHFPKFKQYLPVQPVNVRVLETTKSGVMVDIFGPMMEEFILPRIKQPWIQNQLENYVPVKVKNLHLVRGGYIGQAVIPNVSEFVGEDFVVDAFVPGSQIVQNTTDNFEQFEGQTVETFITAWTPKPGNKGMSLICSAKNLIKHRGNLRLRQLHSLWCENGVDWADFRKMSLPGRITGVINSAKKCGAFVEIPELEITGMIHAKPAELVNFKAGSEVLVHLTDFDEDKFYNDSVGQYQRLQPFEVENGAIKRINIKPIFELA